MKPSYLSITEFRGQIGSHFALNQDLISFSASPSLMIKVRCGSELRPFVTLQYFGECDQGSGSKCTSIWVFYLTTRRLRRQMWLNMNVSSCFEFLTWGQFQFLLEIWTFFTFRQALEVRCVHLLFWSAYPAL